jgi:hypothetical protein
MTERFDATIINARERPLSGDINALQSRQRETLRFMFRYLFSQRTSGADISPNIVNGFLRNSFRVVEASPASMDVVIKSGFGFMDDGTSVPSSISTISGLDDLERYKPVYLSADETVTLAAAPGPGQERYDLIEVKYVRDVTDSASRDVLDTGTGEFAATLVNKTLSWDMSGQTGTVVDPAPSTTAIGIKTGVAAGVGAAVVPSATPGYVPIAVIYVGPAVVAINNTEIQDVRTIAGFDGIIPFGVVTEVLGTVGSPGAPTSFSVMGAEGLQVCGVGWNNGAAAFVDVWIMTPALLTSADVAFAASVDSATAFGGVVDPAATLDLAKTYVIFGNLTGAEQAIVNGAAALPALSAAVGQPYVRISVAPINQAAGVTTRHTAASNRTLRIIGALRVM